jgi:hypothetical protein
MCLEKNTTTEPATFCVNGFTEIAAFCAGARSAFTEAADTQVRSVLNRAISTILRTGRLLAIGMAFSTSNLMPGVTPK